VLEARLAALGWTGESPVPTLASSPYMLVLTLISHGIQHQRRSEGSQESGVEWLMPASHSAWRGAPWFTA